ncbi:MAG TPA: hypothetical protein VGG50_01610 [Streptosporangiaceae bacterium]
MRPGTGRARAAIGALTDAAGILAGRPAGTTISAARAAQGAGQGTHGRDGSGQDKR